MAQMSGKKVVRVALDVALTAMIVAEMFIQFTGVFLHEVIGFAFFATLATHLALSAKWIKSTAGSAKRGSISGRRKALAVMGILLAVNMVVLGASSVAISTILSSAGFEWAFGSYAAWAAVHAVSSYTLCALVALHLGVHWAFLASAFRVPYDPSRRKAIGTGVHAVASLGALALGVMAVRQVAPIAGPGSASAATDDRGESSAGSDGTSEQEGAPAWDDEPYYEEPGTEEAYGDSASDGATTVSGTCTLCRKQCPLSAPQCDKPYRAGLL